MNIKYEIRERTEITKWFCPKGYDTEISFAELKRICQWLENEWELDGWDIDPESDKAKFLIDNKIATYEHGGYTEAENFKPFNDFVKTLE